MSEEGRSVHRKRWMLCLFLGLCLLLEGCVRSAWSRAGIPGQTESGEAGAEEALGGMVDEGAVCDEEREGLAAWMVREYGSRVADPDEYGDEFSEKDVYVLITEETEVRYDGDIRVEETVLHRTEGLPDFADEEEAFWYLRSLYPDMEEYRAYPSYKGYARILEENGVIRAFVSYREQAYELESKSLGGRRPTPYLPYAMRTGLGYASDEDYRWERTKMGGVWYDLREGGWILWRSVGEGVNVRAEISPKEKIRGSGYRLCDVKIYGEPDGELLLTLVADCMESDKKFLTFADLNGDVYQDFLYKDENGKTFCYTWDPSAGTFIPGEDEIESFAFYNTDEDGHRVVVCYEYNWDAERYCIYEWEIGPLGGRVYRKARTFVRDETRSQGNQGHVRIADYRDGEERILADYDYGDAADAYDGDGLKEFFLDDFWLEQSIFSESRGRSYTVRYAARPGEGEGHLWVTDEDFRVVKRLFPQESAPCSSVAWEEDEGGGEPALVIGYEDGSVRRYTESELLRDPAEEVLERGLAVDYSVREYPRDLGLWDDETDGIYREAYYKAISGQTTVRDPEEGYDIYLKGYWTGVGDWYMEMEDSVFMDNLRRLSKFYYMDFDGDGLPELILDISYGDGLHILKYDPGEDRVELFLSYNRMPYYDLAGAGQLCYHNGGLANQDIWRWDTVDEEGRTTMGPQFHVDSWPQEQGDGWDHAYWVWVDDETGSVRVDEKTYERITAGFFEAMNNPPEETTFEELFGEWAEP